MFSEKLKLVPHKPGSYQMINKDGIIIYVGKAKDLNKRLKSYFTGKNNAKTTKLVSEIVDFTYIVANSELEAFIIEINLIKKYDPKYNILLKDDKTYPYIEYIRKPYPKLKVSRYRKIIKSNNNKLFGPFPNAYAARRIVNLLNRIYPLKKCEGKKKEVCLYYHINECLGYCEKKIDNEKIEIFEKEIISFLKGDNKLLKSKILEKINFFNENLNYEASLELKKELEYIEIILEKQKVELGDLINADVVGVYSDTDLISIQIFFIRNGKLVGNHNEIIEKIDDETSIIENYLIKFYSKHEKQDIFIEDIINAEIIENILEIKIKTPQKGKKKELLDMAFANAKTNLENNKLLAKKQVDPNEELRNILNLKILDRIDLFDNSNLFGDFAVSAMVVFKNGKPSKKDYRKYKIYENKNDDYNTMKEVVYRRYTKMLTEKSERPDLIIVDGGINQINACKEILGLLNLDIKVVGLAKNKKHNTDELIDGSTLDIIKLDKTSSVFHYLTRMQDEVHRFTINYHRNIRSKGLHASILDNIEGIGEERKKVLLSNFDSIDAIKNASVEELIKYVPKSIAIKINDYLNEK